MTELELAELLSRTVANVPNGEKTNAYVLFGIKYAVELGSRNERGGRPCARQLAGGWVVWLDANRCQLRSPSGALRGDHRLSAVVGLTAPIRATIPR